MIVVHRIRIALSAVAAAAVVSLAAIPSPGADWPQWRGPERRNQSPETNLLRQWPKDGPPLAWKIDDLGQGFSSVTVTGGRIYTMGDSGADSFVRCLDEKDGRIIWSVKIGRAGESGGYPGPRSTPTIEGGQVYALGREGELVCLDAKDGNEVWRKHLRNDLGGKVPGWGYAEAVLVDGNRLICTPGGGNGTLLALNKKTGATIWRTKDWTDSAHYSSVIMREIHGVPQYIQLTAASVAGVNVTDGRVLWRADRTGKTAVIPTPLSADNYVFVSSGYRVGCNLFKVNRSGAAFSAEEVYAGNQIANHHGGMILLDGHVYGVDDSGMLRCIELTSGKIVWTNPCVASKGSLTYADGHLYVRSESGNGTIALVEATPQGYREKGRFDQPSRSRARSWPHPVVANGKLYVRDQDVLLCYDVRAK
jgi:outer membrane protein assembly factor BamB